MKNNNRVGGDDELLPLTYSGTRIFDAKGRTVGDMRTVAGKELGQYIVDSVNTRHTPSSPLNRSQPPEPSKAHVVEQWNGEAAYLVRQALMQPGDYPIKLNRKELLTIQSALHPSDEVIAGMGEELAEFKKRLAHFDVEDAKPYPYIPIGFVISHIQDLKKMAIGIARDAVNALSYSQKHKPVDGE